MEWLAVNPFAALPDFAGGPFVGEGLPVYGEGIPSSFTMEGGIGGAVNPLAPGLPGATDVSSAGANTDRGRAVSGAQNNPLRGLQAPPPPRSQDVRALQAPQMAAQKSNLSTLLASMGLTPDQMMRLGAMMGR